MLEQLPTMPFIIIAVYIITFFIKKYILKTDSQKASLPPIAAVLGGLIAICLYEFMPGTIVVENIIEACTMGMASGLAAVGCNQVYKQYQKYLNTSSDEDSKE